MEVLKGIFPAMVTPVTDTYKINEKVLHQEIEFLINSGVDGLVLLGESGEYVAVAEKERKTAIDLSLKMIKDRLPLIVGVLSPGIGDAISFATYAKNAGANAILATPPYCVHPSQKGILKYYDRLSREVDIPIIIYNNPDLIGVNILPETTAELATNVKNIIGIKESNVDICYISHIRDLVSGKFSILVGRSQQLFPGLCLGAMGAISGIATVIPEIYKEIYLKVVEGNIEAARKAYYRANPLISLLISGSDSAVECMKYALGLRGIIVGDPMNPLSPLKKNSPVAKKIKNHMALLNLIS
ncbi:MAG: dihydrodipicolinate synthase family protein [Candidatus Hodarchaeota archaeon]